MEVMKRDSSFWNHPDVTATKKYHLVSDEMDDQGFYKARCSPRIRLWEESRIESERVKSLLCKRCFRDN